MGSRIFLLSLVVVLGAACSRTTLKSSVVDTHGSREESSELDFWDGLAETRAISNSDALHALIVSFTDAAPADYAGRVDLATKRGWIDSGDEMPERETTQVGWIARAVCIEAGVKGGLSMRMFGPRKRYAVRELNHMRWLPEMSSNQAISGLQLITMLSKAEDHIAEGS